MSATAQGKTTKPDSKATEVSRNQALQAMSSPIRMRILGVLRINGEQTVGQISEQINEAPGVISYHLGQLSKAHLVEKVESPDHDRRKSWWRACQRATQFDTPDNKDKDSAVSVDMFRRSAALSHELAFERFLDQLPSLPAEWAESCANDDHVLHMTAGETRAMLEEINAVIHKWEKHTAENTDKDDAKPVALTLQVFRWIP